MVRRYAAVCALGLAALASSPAARAQGFFSFYEASPHDVLERLDAQGYSARLPMIRRGDVYVVDARAASGRRLRLIVSARDGAILERYAATPSEDDSARPRWRSDDYGYRRDDDEQPLAHPDRRPQSAFADPNPPRVLTLDGADKPVPPAAVPDAADKPRRHGAKKATDPAVAAVAPADAKPAAPRVIEVAPAKAAPAKPETKDGPDPAVAAVAPVETRPAPAKVIEVAPPKAAPAKTEGKSAPSSQAKAEPAKPAAPRIVGEPIGEPTPTPKAAEKPASAQAEEKPRKKLNDLPVGTLD